MLRSTHEQVRGTIGFYLKNKLPFTYTIQNETISVESKWGSYTSNSFTYSIEEINFIKEVKRYIIKNELYLPYSGYKAEKIMYFKYSDQVKPGAAFTKCVNIDLTGAYWNTAYKLGLLSKRLYKRGLKMSKQVRLSCIGSLAKKTRTYQFDGKKQTLLDIKRSELTEVLWDVICDHVATVLMDTAKACGKDFIFFWVDGIYVNKPALSKVKSVFEKNGYEYKINSIKSIEVTDRNMFVNLVKAEKKIIDGVERIKTRKPFPFRSTEKSGTFKGYNSDL